MNSSGPSEVLDVDALPLTQHLVMEVLAGRYRTGEQIWTFTSRAKTALDALERLGLVGHKSGIVERTRLAWLTPKGRAAVLSDTYEPPFARDRSGSDLS